MQQLQCDARIAMVQCLQGCLVALESIATLVQQAQCRLRTRLMIKKQKMRGAG